MSLNIELARHNMVEQQVRPWDVLDSRVLEALERDAARGFRAGRATAISPSPTCACRSATAKS